MEKLIDIQSVMNGKREDEIHKAIAMGRIVFDESKYRIAKSSRTISGYAADFTDSYKEKMTSIIPQPASMDVYIKLDGILTEGFEYDDVFEEELYPSPESVFYGMEKSIVKVYNFIKDEETRQVIVNNDDGSLIKKSIKGALTASNYTENNYIEILEKQDYIMDLFGTDRRTASYVVNKLSRKDDEVFYNILDSLRELSRKFLNNLSANMKSNSGKYGDIFKFCSEHIVRAALFEVAGDDEEIQYALKVMCHSRSNNKKQNKFGIYKIRDLIKADMKEEMLNLLMSNDIELYRNALRAMAMQNISYTANLTDTEKETASFLLKHGTYDDFSAYMQNITYTKDNEVVVNSLPDEIVERLYDSLKNQDVCMPLSYYYISSATLKLSEMSNVFIENVCKNKGYDFDIFCVANEIMQMKAITRKEQKQAVLHIINNVNSDEECYGYLYELCEKIIKRLYKNVCSKIRKGKMPFPAMDSEFDILKGRDNNKAFVQYNQDYTVLSVTMKIFKFVPNSQRSVSDSQFEIRVDIHLDDIAGYILDNRKYLKLMDEIIANGLQTLDTDGMHAIVKGDEGKHFIQFIKGGELYHVEMLGAVTSEIYDSRVSMHDALSYIHSLYSKAYAIYNKGDFASLKALFQIPDDLSVSPDKILNNLIACMCQVRVASEEGNPIAEYILNDSDVSIKSDVLMELQKIVRETYCHYITMEGEMLQCKIPDMYSLFHAESYSIKDGCLSSLPNCMSNCDGSLYIGIHKIGWSENIKNIHEAIQAQSRKSTESLADYRQIKMYENENKCNLTQDKILCLKQHVQANDITKDDLVKCVNEIRKANENEENVESICSMTDEILSMADIL